MTQVTSKQKARLRRTILQFLDAAKVAGGLRGRPLADLLEDTTDFPDEPYVARGDDALVVALCSDLADAGLIHASDERTRDSQALTLDRRAYRISAQGTALLAEAIAPHPLVADERMP